MRAFVLSQVPDAYIPTSIAADELALIWMDYDVVDRHTVTVVSLDVSGPSIPDFYRAIFGASDHPFAFAVERNTSNVARMSFKSQNGGRVCRLDVVKFDSVMSSGGQESLVW